MQQSVDVLFPFCWQTILSNAGGRKSTNGPPEWTLIKDCGLDPFEPLPLYMSEMPVAIINALKEMEEGGGGFSNAGSFPTTLTLSLTPSSLYSPLSPCW